MLSDAHRMATEKHAAVGAPGKEPCRRNIGLRLTAILTNEATERFAAYGLRALLVLYLKSALKLPESTSIAIYSGFIALCYFSPLLGGYLADTVLGKWLTIIVFNGIYIVGALVLGATAFTPEQVGAFVGLFLIAVGTGGIKPNVSAFGAEQIDKKNKGLKDSFFNLFYWCINIGSALAFLTMPLIRGRAGYGWAYMTSFFAVVLSLTIFVVPSYNQVPPAKESAWAKLWRVFRACCARRAAGTGAAPQSIAVAYHDDATDTESDAAGLLAAGGGGATPAAHGNLIDEGVQADAADAIAAAAATGAAAADEAQPAAAAGDAAVATAATAGAAGSGGGDPAAAVGGVRVLIAHPHPLSPRAGAPPHGGAPGAGEHTVVAHAPRRSIVHLEIDEDDETEEEQQSCSCINGARGWGKTSSTEIREVRAVLKLLPIFAILPLFWAIFDSQGSIWTLQRTHMDNCIGKLCMEPEQLGILNPLLVIVLVPIFDQAIFPFLAWLGTKKVVPKATDAAGNEAPGSETPVPVAGSSDSKVAVATGKDGKATPAAAPERDSISDPSIENAANRNLFFPTPLRRMGAGMQIAAISFFMTAGVQAAIDKEPANSVNVSWQVPQFVFLTVAEICVSITGLEFAYNQAPRTMRSTVLSLYLVSVAIGNLLTGVVYAALSSVMTSLQLILMFAVVMCVGGIVFIFLAIQYRPSRPAPEHED